MLIFSRRALQRLLDALGTIFPREQLEGLVRRLNRPGDDRLPAMWEVTLLFALSRVGLIAYEAQLSSGRKPDLAFTYPGENRIGFFADVTTISDSGLNKDNPVQLLSDELVRITRRVGLDPNHIFYDVESRRDGDYGDGKVRLLLPSRGALARVINTKILPFLRRIKRENLHAGEIKIEEDGVALRIGYNADQRFMSGGHSSYDVALSLQKNPLWNALRSKADQLKQTAKVALAGVIVCDGGCALLRQRHKPPDRVGPANPHRTISGVSA
jgi:hypothetical protein